MHLSNANKALIITILLSASVVLMAFNFHLKKKNNLVAETYYELIDEDDEFFEEQEELAEILKSLDEAMTTNRAFNETKKYEPLEEKDFQETLERVRNRNAEIEDNSENTLYENTTNEDDLSSYDDINNIIEKRSEKKRDEASEKDGANKNSSMSYSLVDRELLNNPTPIYLCESGGKIVINITVDKEGNVIEATYNATASSSNNGCLIDHALEYAQAAKFDANATKLSQIGSITFFFRGKR